MLSFRFRSTLFASLLASAALTLAALPVDAQYVGNGFLNANGKPVALTPGSALVAGPALAAFTFSGTVTDSANGSIHNSILSVVQSGTVARVVVPVGAVLSGSGVTTGATVVADLGNDNYALATPSGASAGNFTTAVTVTATPSFTNQVRDTLSGTAPTYASGGCTTTAAFVTGSTPYFWTLKQGASGCSTNKTITLTFPAATTTWMCSVNDVTTATTNIISTGAASTTAVVLSSYDSTGTLLTMVANEVYSGICIPH